MKNPEDTRETWLNRIEKGKGRDIAREFFYTYTTHEKITEKLYPKAFKVRKKKNQKNFVMPLITTRVKEWKSYGFFDESIPIPKEVLRYGEKHIQTFFLSLLNLEPIYKYCKDYKSIEFTEEEKSYLNSLFLNEVYRKLILEEYPDESVVQATLRFYVKNCINRYLFYLRDIRENPEKYSKEIKKAEDLNNPSNDVRKWYDKTMKDINKRYSKRPYKKKDFDVIKIVSLNKITEGIPVKKKNEKWSDYIDNVPSSQALNHLFSSYIQKLETNPALVRSVDDKILRSLNLSPSL